MNKVMYVYSSAKPSVMELLSRVSHFIQRKPYRRPHGPRWQQLELPLSHTPVQRWNR